MKLAHFYEFGVQYKTFRYLSAEIGRTDADIGETGMEQLEKNASCFQQFL